MHRAEKKCSHNATIITFCAAFKRLGCVCNRGNAGVERHSMRMLAGLGCRSFNFFVLASRYMNKIWVFKRKQRSRERVKRHYYYFSYLLLPNKNSFCVRINKNITRCCWSRARAYSLSQHHYASRKQRNFEHFKHSSCSESSKFLNEVGPGENERGSIFLPERDPAPTLTSPASLCSKRHQSED